MKMKIYKTRPGLWFAISVVIFIAIGLLVKFDNKGVNECLLRLVGEWVALLFSGREGLDAVPFLALWLGTWTMVAGVLGWFVQSCVVIILSRSREKTKRLA